jgi:hypothetical protein
MLRRWTSEEAAVRLSILVMTTLALTACGQERAAAPAAQPPASSPRPTASPALPATPPPAPASPWSLQVSAAAGVAIVLADEAGGERMRIACRRNPNDLHVSAPAFRKIGSEERLTLGAGDELATLVVVQGAPAGAPLQAAGELPPAFVEALSQGRQVTASYGASTIGPIDPPADQIRSAFVAACRSR